MLDYCDPGLHFGHIAVWFIFGGIFFTVLVSILGAWTDSRLRRRWLRSDVQAAEALAVAMRKSHHRCLEEEMRKYRQ